MTPPQARRRAVQTNILAFLAALFLLAGCSTPPPGNSFAEQTWDHKPDIRLLVGEIRVDKQYIDQAPYPHAELQAPRTPSQALENWARRRLVAAGSGGRAVLTITDGRIVQSDLPEDKGTLSFFSSQRAHKFDGRLAARLSIENASGVRVGQVEAVATRYVSIGSGVTLNEREELLFQLVEQMVASLDQEMEKQVRLHLGPYTVP